MPRSPSTNKLARSWRSLSIGNILSLLFVLTVFGTVIYIVAWPKTNADRATEVLTAQGYSEIEITGYGWLDCSDDDAYATAFTATAPSGSKVDGTVCSGWFKGNTVRLD